MNEKNVNDNPLLNKLKVSSESQSNVTESLSYKH